MTHYYSKKDRIMEPDERFSGKGMRILFHPQLKAISNYFGIKKF